MNLARFIDLLAKHFGLTIYCLGLVSRAVALLALATELRRAWQEDVNFKAFHNGIFRVAHLHISKTRTGKNFRLLRIELACSRINHDG